MQRAIELALEDANLAPSAIGYGNAHGTATEQGDIAESTATSQVFGPGMPISSLKSYMGHTLGACGALEAWISIAMMRESWFAPTLNLGVVDARCGQLDYICMGANDAAAKLSGDVKFFFAGQPPPKVLEKLGTDKTSQKTNSFGKSNEKACNWVFLSSMLRLEKRAKELGANAVVNIVSNYGNAELASATEFECHVGAIMAGVALKGDFVRIAK